jgi:hypothetical protein
MFVVKIHYGLGNQLFQYAVARRISVERQMPFKMDISFYSKGAAQGEVKRFYDLNKFKIVEQIATEHDLVKFSKRSIANRLSAHVEKALVPYYGRRVVYEKELGFDPNIMRIKSGSYLNGYWQSEEYFKPIEDLIRRDFEFRHAPDQSNAMLLSKIKSTPSSVAIHIRRGDYLTDKMVASVLYPCPMTYYQHGINYLTGKLENPFFFIFSDDPEWVAANFKLEYPHYLISGLNANRPEEELRLMSSCQHFIITNSSFSWWGAWLGQSHDKIVVAPKLWFRSGLNIASESWFLIN